MIRIESADHLRSVARDMSLTRRCEEIRLPAGVMDLGDEPVVFGGVAANRETLTGLKIVGEGRGHVNHNGRAFGGTVLRYSSAGAAIDLRGVSSARLQDFGIHAPNGIAATVKASVKNSAWSKQVLFERIDVSGSGIGFDLVGVDGPDDYIGHGQISQFGYGQVDTTWFEGCIARRVNIALRQNSPNSVNTTWVGGEIKARAIGFMLLEGTARVYGTVFVDDPDDLGWAAIYAKNAHDILIHRNRFELDQTPAYVIEESYTGIGSQLSSKDNLITHGSADTPGIRVARRNLHWISDDQLAMRGTKSWRMEVATDIESWIERRPRNPQVEIVRI